MKRDHTHSHGQIAAEVMTSREGIHALKLSFIILALTAILQLVVVYFSGSVGLLADTIHNVGDALTSIPLWIAFLYARKRPTKRFTYGYGRIEDLAGVCIVMIILASAVAAAYMAFERLLHPQPMTHIFSVLIASVIGFIGNEWVAIYRIRVGKKIGSGALVADGHHARIDGFTSLAVFVGGLGVWLGFPLADPIVGLLITVVILKVVWDVIKIVFTRLLDGIDPEIIDEIRHAVTHVTEVHEVTEVRARWIGHRIHAELNIALDPDMTVVQAHEIAKEVQVQLLEHLTYLSNAVVHIDPSNESGESHHNV